MLYHLKIITINHECCCMPSETYGRNWATPIFRSFHRTASSTISIKHYAASNIFLLKKYYSTKCGHTKYPLNDVG